ncbi:hypothetical protein [Pyxidicoccus caerfyrddinensis]|uniref:hypothetical protein n=1 Tax=Pyxidicoccus caerfyrddinensis TaxID=2709663 RepID=UPI0013DBCEFB|nr:hypothetical protein [Pyxidicoccus caerfyrddinensis]
MKTWHVLVVGTLAGAWLIASFVQQQHAHEAFQALSTRVELLATERREVPPPREDVPTPVVREVRVEVPAKTPTAPTPVAEQQPLPGPVSAPRPVPVEVVSERIEERFGTEPPDTAWARDAEHTAEGGVRAALPDHSLLRSVECRASMCRIETEHGDPERSQTFVRTAFMTPGRQVWNGGFLSMRSEDSADGKVVMVTYLARQGMELPMNELLAPVDGSSGR